ncbi:hypothetical protein SLOPH_1663 [Spraguea lophii 42_110]|uniref:Mitochondrial import inner membrane translocase subunit TIM50 n=1 Tax=Spraguea lophii (strain 42_110) TaxID=1358809 RepID=S7W6X1_SPRLO|nr:hypothetical protein SLOPH_1663 [Spraguea lophii 42_110]
MSEINFLVFDINKTLIRKSKEPSEYKLNNIFIHPRPHLSKLINFIKEHNLECMLWTNSQPTNAQILANHLKDIGMPHITVFNSTECDYSREPRKGQKPLHKIYKLGYSPYQAVLIDDSYNKVKNGDNYILVKSYIKKDDNEILYLIQTLDLYIKCKRKKCSGKMVKEINNVVMDTYPKLVIQCMENKDIRNIE